MKPIIITATVIVLLATFIGYQWGASTAKPIDQGNISGLRK